MSIESEIERLTEAKSDLASAIEEYGVSVASETTLDEYGNLVRSIVIPTALPNPCALTFTGAVDNSYDGSAEVTVKIPSEAIKLWEGSWSTASGATLTVAANGGSSGCTGLGNISDYKLLLACVGGSYPYILCNDGSTVIGGGVIFSVVEYEANSKNGCVVRGIRMSISGNTLTAEYHAGMKSTATQDISSTMAITAIYGIPLKEA